MSEDNNHKSIWSEINDLKREVKATREDVAHIRGYLEGKNVRQEHAFSWKGIATNAASVIIAVVSLIVSVFIGTRP